MNKYDIMGTITVLAAMFYGNGISVIAGLSALLAAYIAVNLQNTWFITKVRGFFISLLALIALASGAAAIASTIYVNAYLI